MPEVLDYLASKGHNPKGRDGKEQHFTCFFCDESHSARGRLYIDVEEENAPYHCKICDARGNIYTLKRHFGDPIHEEEETPDTQWILQQAAQHYHESLVDHFEALHYLKERGLTTETIVEHLLGFCDGSFAASQQFTTQELQQAKLLDGTRETLQGMITIPYMTDGKVVQIRGKYQGGKYKTPPGEKNRLFNTKATKGTEPVLICEGEFDCLMATQAGFRAVGVPGAGGWQESWSSYFDNIRKAYVVFDNDDAGRKGAQKVVEALGPKARIVDIGPATPEGGQDDKNDLSDWFNQGHTAEELDLLCKATNGSLLVTVDDAYDEWQQLKDVEPIGFGFSTLDLALQGGMRPGQIAIPLARSGTGKTLFLLNIFQRVLTQHPDLRILFVSLEQTKFEWLVRATMIYQFYHPEAEMKDVLDFFRPRFLICEQNRLNEEQLLSCFDDFEDRLGGRPDLVAIDYLGYWTHSFKGEPYQRVSTGIMTLKAIAKEQRIPIITPHQVGRAAAEAGKPFGAEAARDSGVVEETADFVFAMWAQSSRVKEVAPKHRKEELHLKIAKSRHGSKDREITLLYAPLSQALVEPGEAHSERAQMDAYYNDKHMSQADARIEYQTGSELWHANKHRAET